MYQDDSFIQSGEGNDWHYVWITDNGDGINYTWNNMAGYPWSLIASKN